MSLSAKYIKELFFRFFIMLTVVVLAFLIHRFFLSSSTIIWSIVIVLLLTLGLLIYYISIFHKRTIHDIEFIISFIIIFFLTITFFAMIYDSSACVDGNCFLNAEGQRMSLSFSDAFYFSTTVITTLGSGIEPLGVFRFFVISEVLLGLIYVGLMIYFLTRVIEKRNQ